MKITSMFEKDINRPINGVIQVGQEESSVIQQEVSEYVITSELKKHFNHFFESYSQSFVTPTDNTGVWITGFFGSGKSHFLKMLSYLLENKEIDGKPTVEYFREKYDDELSFMNIENSTKVPTETILFNIDVEGSMTKADTAVLRVFAKTFYEHLGFYGKDLKLAKLEQFISKRGKFDEFKAVFEEKNGESWISSREDFAFWEDDIVDTLVEVLGMSEEAAHNWFNGTETADISIGQLVDEINDYVKSKPEGFRLLFMIDEAGQYIGTNTSLLLNLQSLIEKLGSVCRGQVWVVATGQEALDDMIKLRTDEFSRIMARFSVRLSLTSSSVGEVIEKRLLTKTPQAYDNLEMVYDNNDSVLSNLYSIQSQKQDLKGYRSKDEFARVFPFVPYQFLIMKDVFNEIRKKGHAGKHQSSGERSMLNGFQESAQKIQEKDEFAVVPMYYFYDTLHSFLDTAIRNVIERAERAAANDEGLSEFDVNLLKLLYLIRYIDDIPSNIENLTILMADDIRVEKKALREEVQKSLQHLENQNYISRSGDVFLFLTDEEQDIAREIKNTDVDNAAIVKVIGDLIFDDIYKPKKFKHGQFDFAFNQYVDDKLVGSSNGDVMKIKFMTMATDAVDRDERKLLVESKGDEAICVLSEDYSYFQSLETIAKIKKYAKQINVNEKPVSIQKIIQNKQTEARCLEELAREELQEAIKAGKFYICGEKVELKGSSAEAKINEALKYMVEHIFYNLGMINEIVESEADVKAVLNGNSGYVKGLINAEACNDMERYLQLQSNLNMPTSMYDIQTKYTKKPYGWRELDVAMVTAQLLFEQRVTIKYAGETIKADDQRMIGYLRKSTEIGNAKISVRENISVAKLNQVRTFLREYFDIIDIPNDEDTLIGTILDRFNDKLAELKAFEAKNVSKNGQVRFYPGYKQIMDGIELVRNILDNKGDNLALINAICESEDDLLDNSDDMKEVAEFFDTQFTLFKRADEEAQRVDRERDFFSDNEAVKDALSNIRVITKYEDNYNYSRIPKLNDYIAVIRDARLELIESKKKAMLDLISQCMEEVESKAREDEEKLAGLLNQARVLLDTKRDEVLKISELTDFASKEQFIISIMDNCLAAMDRALRPEPKPQAHREEREASDTGASKVKEERKARKNVKEYRRQVIHPTAAISSEEDIEKYLDDIREKLMRLLDGCDELMIR